MKVFTRTVDDFKLLTIFAKSSIEDLWQDSEFASEASNDLQKNSISDVLQGFLFAFVAIIYFRKTVGSLFTKFD